MRIISRLFGFLPVLGLVLLSGCASEEERFQQHVSRAAEYAAEDSLKEASLELRSALKLKPHDPDVNFRIGELLSGVGDVGDAVFFYREAQRLSPGHLKAMLGEVKLELGGDLERVEELLAEAAELYPDDPTVHLARSSYYLVREDLDAAEAAAKLAVELDPSRVEFHSQVGLVAQARIRAAKLEESEAPDAVFEAALEVYRRAESLGGPARYIPRYEQARVLAVWEGHSQEAEEAFRSANELAAEDAAPASERLVLLGSARMHARSIEDRDYERWVLEEMVAVAPDRLWAWLALGRLAEHSSPGSGAAAVAHVLEAQPESAAARLLYADFLIELDRRDDAFAFLLSEVEAGVEPAALLGGLVARQLRGGNADAASETAARLQQEHPESTATVVSSARIALSEGRLTDAVDLLASVAEPDENAEVLLLRGTIELRLRRLRDARETTDRALALARPATADLLRLRARVEIADGDTAAVATLEKLPRTGQLSERDGHLFVAAHYVAGQRQQGRRLLTQLFERYGASPTLALQYWRLEGRKHPVRAEKVLLAAAERAPKHAGVLRALASLDHYLGRSESALGRLDALLEASENPATLLQRARVHTAMGELGLAEVDAQRAFELSGTENAAILLADAYSAQGKEAEAIEALETARDAGALRGTSLTLLGRLYLGSGQLDEAKAAYEQALESGADLPAAMNDLAFLEARTDAGLDRALELASVARKRRPNRPEFADTLGYVYYRRKIPAAAAEQFRVAIELAATLKKPRAEYHYNLGRALRDLGDPGGAVKEFEAALEMDPGFPDADAARRELSEARAATDAA